MLSYTTDVPQDPNATISPSEDNQDGLERLLSEACDHLKVQFAAALTVEDGVITAVPDSFFETTLFETIGDYCTDGLCFSKSRDKKNFKAHVAELSSKTRIKRAIRKFRRKIKPGKTGFYQALQDFDDFAADLTKQFGKLLPKWLADNEQPHILNRYLPIGSAGTDYLARLEVIGGSPPYIWNVETDGGSLNGLDVQDNGDTCEISGTAASACWIPVKLTVTDAHDRTATREMVLHAMSTEQAEGNVDLEISSFKVKPKRVKAGQALKITYSLKNVGARTAEPFAFGIYLSKDDKISTADYPLFVRHLDMLCAGKTAPAAKTRLKVNMPYNLWDTGDHHIGAIVDFNGVNSKHEENLDLNILVEDIEILQLFRPPVADLSASPTAGVAPLQVTFDAQSSYDPDGGAILLFRFYFGDGSDSGWNSTGTAVHTYNHSGTYQAHVIVRDDETIEATSTDLAIQVVDPGEFNLSMDVYNVMPSYDSLYPATNWIPARFHFDVGNSSHTTANLTYFKVDYGDGTQSAWFNFAYPTTERIYYSTGTYNARLKLRNEYGFESNWSNPYPITTTAYTGSCDVALSDIGLNHGVEFTSGDLVVASSTQTNNGPDVAPPFVQEMWLSPDAHFDDTDTNITASFFYWAPGIPVGRVWIYGQEGRVPASLPLGDYYVIIRAIVVGDTNLSNNHAISTGTIEIK